MELFLSSTCPHCQHEKTFFDGVAKQHPELAINYHFIDQDKNALIQFNQLLSEQQQDDFAVPSVFFCDSRWVGFANAETTGKDLLHAIDYCQQQISQHSTLTSTTVSVLRQWANANRFDSEWLKILLYLAT